MPNLNYKRISSKRGSYSPRPAVRVIGASIAYIVLTRGFFSCIDLEDADVLERWNWYADVNKKTGSIYAKRVEHTADEKSKSIFMHQALLPSQDGKRPDHKGRFGLDNRRANLRLASPTENAMNRSVACNNKTGAKGVYKRNGAFEVSIRVNRILLHQGYRKDFAEAVALRKAAEAKYFGEFAPQ